MKVSRLAVDLYKSDKRYNVLRGGAGSGKSFAAVQTEIRKADENIERVLVIRKVKDTLRGSIFQLFLDVLGSLGWTRGTDYQLNESTLLIKFANGSKFIFAGLDDVEKLKSIAGITRIIIEEADQISEDDFDQLDLRLRGLDLRCPQITMMFNPVSINHWLKKRFFDQTPESTYIQLSSYRDNPFLDESYKNMLKRLEFSNPSKYRVYVLNEWGIEDTEKLFIRKFKNHEHIQECKFDNTQDVYLAFDLNYDPTCLVIQKHDHGFVVLQEYGEKGLTLPYLCATIRKDFPSNFYFVNGDASGHYSKNLTDNNTSYEIIKSSFGLSWSQFNVPKANPSHKRSRLQCNALFDFGSVIINPQCKNLIADAESAIVDEKGSLDTWKKENPTRSHWIDPMRYHIAAEHDEFISRFNFEELIK